MLNLLLDFFFPCYCISCGVPISSRSNYLCINCRSTLPFATNNCERCGSVLHDGLCLFCNNREVYISKHISIFEYRGTAKAALHGLKFKGLKNIAMIFPDYIVSAIDSMNEQIDIVTYVPMSWKKLRARGYNHCELIAKCVASKRGFCFKKTLEENKGYIAQREFGDKERFINVIDRYRVISKSNLFGKSVLIIDDVFTTGATVNECARKLLEAGAAKVFSVTIARADIKKLENI